MLYQERMARRWLIESPFWLGENMKSHGRRCIYFQRARHFMWWQIDSPRSKRVTNTAARPFDWRFSPNGINRPIAGSPREPDELTACPLVFPSCDIGGRSGRRACIQLCGKRFRSRLFAVVAERSLRLVESYRPFWAAS